MIDVRAFCWLCTDGSAKITIYDMNPMVEDNVFTGTMADAMYSDYKNSEVWSYDFVAGTLILNIDTSDNEEE